MGRLLSVALRRGRWGGEAAAPAVLPARFGSQDAAPRIARRATIDGAIRQRIGRTARAGEGGGGDPIQSDRRALRSTDDARSADQAAASRGADSGRSLRPVSRAGERVPSLRHGRWPEGTYGG